MAWWRRDPSLWSRSPVHRYAQRILRDHEAALRTRCFSLTPSKTAQHQDHDGASRPEGMTDLEWAQLQHYRKWRKRLQEHPYKALFGASEDMLRGKGLTDWEWVYKTFPKWMLREMDVNERVEQGKNENKDDHGRRHGDISKSSTQAKVQPSAEREPTFAQPVIRTTHYERDEFGIVSPSDLRRPKECVHVKVVGKLPQKPLLEGNESAPVPSQKNVESDLEQQDAIDTQPLKISDRPKDGTTTASETFNPESLFIDAFFADEPKVYDRDLGNSKSWRQTALQRQSTSDAIARPEAGLLSIAKAEVSAAEMAHTPKQEPIVIPSSQALVDNYPYPKTSNSVTAGTTIEKKTQQNQKEVGKPVLEATTNVRKVDIPEPGLATARSTSAILEKLPKDDIDFLSAADIRAVMGTRKSGTKSNEEKKQDRQKLETGYATAQPEALNEVVEAHVLNNYYIRRTQQELERARTASHASELNGTAAGQDTSRPLSELPQMESSIDRMRKWIEQGGASFSKHFWQDPIEANAPSEADLQFAKQMVGLGKCRRAREHISDDLEADLPMCKGLLERLKNDENRVEHAVYLLRSPRKTVPDAEISKSLRAVRERRLRNTYERTENQFESACQALLTLQGTEAVSTATNAFKRRLGIASKILHKNATLTRMLTWSAQARLDEPDQERSKAELYSEILTRLATLRDTQLALARLMDHAVQVYRVAPTAADEALSTPVSKDTDAITESPTLADDSSVLPKKATAKSLADTAATTHLAEEVQSQKAAMRGLSDDGYERVPKQTLRRSFEEKNPLAHSLFRPFTLQLDSLGKETDGEAAAQKLRDAFKQKIGDRKLVQEVRSAYEDVYGPITVEHRQVPHTEESASAEAKDADAFETVKEDPTVEAATAAHEKAKHSETAVVSEPPVVEATANEAEAVSDTTLPFSTSEAVNSEPSSTAPSTEGTASAASTTASKVTTRDASPTDLPTHYTILVHDPQTDALSITTSTSGPPRDTSPALPIHQALSTLKAPAKFIPYIAPGLEVIAAKRHVLVLRDALDDATSTTRGFETIRAPPSAAELPNEPYSSEVNPIDGTSRLSPTGYSGVEQSQEQLERDFEERREAAAATAAARSKKSSQQARRDSVPKKKRGGVGSVVKTAIWAGAACYIVGVIGEVLR